MGQSLPLKAIFFDARDTLGEVDKPGHLVPFRPTTERLLEAVRAIGLKIGVITNLPPDISAAQGRQMVTSAQLSQDPTTGAIKTIGDFIPAANIVTNHDAGFDKPDPRIYSAAAAKLGVKTNESIFVGENLIECLGAQSAGMRTELKPYPPGHEFLPSLISKLGASPLNSGRAFEALFEHEHLLGERIFACGRKIVETLKKQNVNKAPAQNVRTSMGIFVYLINNFADQAHLRAEEAVIPIAIARGMDPKKAEFVYNHHEQARAYWAGITLAYKRILTGASFDRALAYEDFWRLTEAFVILFEAHAKLENDHLYPNVGAYLDDGDDTRIMTLLGEFGWKDIGPFAEMVGQMEQQLGITPPPAIAAPASPKLAIKAKGGAGIRPKKAKAASRPRASR